MAFSQLLNIRREYILVCMLLFLFEYSSELLCLHMILFRLRDPTTFIVLHSCEIRDVYLVVATVLFFFDLSPSSLEALKNVDDGGNRGFG